MRLRDFKYYFKKQVVTVTNVTVVGDDFRLIDFSIPDGLHWRAGQHGLFSFGVKLVGEKSEYPYSISSIMEEGVLRIAVKIFPPLNQYKERFLALKPGDTLFMRGPIGPFCLQDTYSPVVLVAGGIGITPVRALLKYIVSRNDEQAVHVVYASEKDYIFEPELRSLADSYGPATIDFVRGVEAPKELTLQYAEQYRDKAYYYISGGKRMILAYRHMLREQGVSKHRIIHDPFYRY